MFASNDIPLLKKIKKRTLLDLALTIPQSYQDTTLSRQIIDNSTLTARVKVTSSTVVGGRLRVQLLLLDFNQSATALFFKTTPYHVAKFKVDNELIISGRATYFRGQLQINQPKILTNFGQIIPKYKTTLKESQMHALIAKYITQETLQNAGLFSNEIDTLLTLHFPTTLEDIYSNGTLKPNLLNALKSIEAYNHLIKLKRKRIINQPVTTLHADIEPFINTLPFTLTKDQLEAIKTVQKDLSNSNKAAKRVIIGDVGSGKTMVILAAAYIANSKKTILMAPTSLLAQQLYQEAQKYLSNFLTIAFVSQKKSEGDYTKADLIIGTHALLYKEDLPKVALLIVDEQHRFGANQRALLEALVKQDNKSAHYLQFSATPIPRTQAMIESELIDITTIKMLPFKKMIDTKIISKKDFSNLLEHIKEEIKNKHQVIIVYPLVEPSDEIPYTSLLEAKNYWEKNFDNVYTTYGKDKSKDETLLEFKERGDILLTTTVIEVGISLPRLTTIVIVGAERFGLATLHQLRGRVGRYGIESYCYLYTNAKEPPQRLKEFASILDGFEIARLDLKYRNSGDLLDGSTQSGKRFQWLDLSEDEEIIKQAKERVKKITHKTPTT